MFRFSPASRSTKIVQKLLVSSCSWRLCSDFLPRHSMSSTRNNAAYFHCQNRFNSLQTLTRRSPGYFRLDSASRPTPRRKKSKLHEKVRSHWPVRPLPKNTFNIALAPRITLAFLESLNSLDTTFIAFVNHIVEKLYFFRTIWYVFVCLS